MKVQWQKIYIYIYLRKNLKSAYVTGWQRIKWRVAQDEAPVGHRNYVTGVKDFRI